MKSASRSVLENALWAGLLLLLPITSLPLIANLIGSQNLAAPSILLLFGLALGWLAPYLLKRGPLPIQAAPLFVFASVALFSALLAIFLPTPASLAGQPGFGGSLEGLLTLAIGMSAFLLAALWPRSWSDLHRLLRWVNISGAILIGWSLLQALTYDPAGYPGWVTRIQETISTTGFLELYKFRAYGLAFEPSWVAHQLNMLYLPLWLAAAIRRTTAHRWSLGKLHFEDLLLAGGLLTLFLTYSRIGWAAILVVLALVFIGLNVRAVRWARSRWTSKPSRLLPALIIAGMALFYLFVLAGVIFVMVRLDERMTDLFQTLGSGERFIDIAYRLVFAERVLYWQAGWRVFDRFPIFGAGLGNAGYYFSDLFDPMAWRSLEIRRILYQFDFIPNVKNLWLRLLAETGLVGFAVWTAWLYTLWKTAQSLISSAGRNASALGLAGLFALTAWLLEGLSIDSFGFLYVWLLLGWVVAAWRLTRSGQPADEQVSDMSAGRT